MKKRILGILLVLAMAVCMLPMAAFADTEVEAFNLSMMELETGNTFIYHVPRIAESVYDYGKSWNAAHLTGATIWYTYLDEYNVEQTIDEANFETTYVLPETVYTCHVAMSTLTGYYFADPPKITFNGEEIAAADMDWDPSEAWHVTVRHTFEKTAPKTPIPKLEISMKDPFDQEAEPLWEKTPNHYTVTCFDWAEVSSVSWFDGVGNSVASTDLFQSGETYTMLVTLTASPSGQFTEDTTTPEVCVINPDYAGHGKTPDELNILTEDTIQLKYKWTIPEPIGSIALYTNRQAWGEHPVSLVWTDNDVDYFVEDVKWFDEWTLTPVTSEDVLQEEDHIYALEIYIQPKAGHSLSPSISAANVTLNGAPVDYAEYNYTYLRVYTPALVGPAELIHSADVLFDYPIKIGEYAEDYAYGPDDAAYDVLAAEWFDADGNNIYDFYFADNTTYTMKITVDPGLGRLFADDATFTFNGEPVETVETNGTDRVLVLTFELTSWDPIILPEIAYDFSMGMRYYGDYSKEKATLKAAASDGAIIVTEGGSTLSADLDKDGTADISISPDPEDAAVDVIQLLDTCTAAGEITLTLNEAEVAWLKSEMAPAYYTGIKFSIPEKVTLSFLPNGGSGSMEPVTLFKGDGYVLPVCGFTAPEGKEFDEWDVGAAGDTITVDGDMTAEAQWKDKAKEKWTITLSANDESGVFSVAEVNKGEKYVLPDCTFPAPEGKEFDKWDAGVPGEEIAVEADMTVKALWKDKSKIRVNPFSDVSEGDYFYDAVIWAYYAEPFIVNGMVAPEIAEDGSITTPGLFGPQNTVTRGQAVTFLWRAMGEPEPTITESPFVDIYGEDYYWHKAILWAVEKGIVKGTDATHYTPYQTCSTAHMVTFLFRTLGIGEDGWYEEAGNWAKELGLLDGMGLEVSRAVDCPRGSVVTFLYRALAKD